MTNESVSVRLIVGNSRGGTTALIKALSMDSRVIAFGETAFWGRHWREPKLNGGYDGDDLEVVAHYLENSCLRSFEQDQGFDEGGIALGKSAAGAVKRLTAPVSPCEVFRVACNQVAAARGGLWFVEKTPHHVMHLDRIFQHCDNARVVVLMREPIDFLMSYKFQWVRKSEPLRTRFRRRYHPLLVALLYRGTANSAHLAMQREPGRVLVVRLEQLIADQGFWISRIQEHLKLPPYQVFFEKDNSSFSSSGALNRSPTIVERSCLSVVAGSAARRLGYTVEKPRWRMVWAVVAIFSLFPWAIANVRGLNRVDEAGLWGLVKRWVRL